MKLRTWLMASALMLMNTLPALARTGPFIFLEDPEALSVNRERLAANDATLRKAYARLIEAANRGLQQRPVSVTEKTQTPPSGDKHDYMSLAPYHWPDPSKPDGRPYLRKDGQTNPEVKTYLDKENFPALCRTIHTLALAWHFSRDERYATHAAKLMRVWFLDSATRMNPNLNFGQAIMGVNTGRGSGLIDTRHLLKVVDAVGLLQGSRAWTEPDQVAMQTWMSQFLDWMQSSPLGQDESQATNNHGIWYDAQRLAMALFTGQKTHAMTIIASVEARLQTQMDANGLFPAELERTTSLHYSVFAMEPLFSIARMARYVDVDLLDAHKPSGQAMKRGFDALLPYMTRTKVWTGQQIKPFDFSETIPLLAMGAVQYGCSTCVPAIQRNGRGASDDLSVYLTERLQPRP